ncbi:T-complex protein 1 subunit gamma [Castilleja foliolosa]
MLEKGQRLLLSPENYLFRAGEMLHVVEAFIDKNYHPTVICRAYNKAPEDAVAALDKITMTVDVKDRAIMSGLVKSCIGTKFTSQFGDLIAGHFEKYGDITNLYMPKKITGRLVECPMVG